MQHGELLRGEIQKARAAKGAADVVLEVLDLIEVAGPMHIAMPGAAASAQIRGAAQALATPGEVPGPPVVPAIDVAGGAGDVAVCAHARVGGVVEDLFA